MKCEENGGCPFRGSDCGKFEGYCQRFGEVGVSLNEDECGNDNGRLESYFGCHLSHSDFPLINAMIAGEAEHKSYQNTVTGRMIHEVLWAEEPRKEA